MLVIKLHIQHINKQNKTTTKKPEIKTNSTNCSPQDTLTTFKNMDTHVAMSQWCIPRNSAHCLSDSPADACHFFLGGWGMGVGGGGGAQYYWTLALHEALPPRICALSLSTTGQQEKGTKGL